MKEQLQHVSEIMQFSSAVVEAGHFYANKPFGSEQQVGIEIGIATVHALSEMGLKVTPCMLVDDYNTQGSHLPENLTQAQVLGFSPDVVFRENDFVPQGLAMLEKLHADGKTKVRKSNREVYLKEGFIKLVKEDGSLTCALLDAMLYEEKHQQFGGICVTVLPDRRSYRTQQVYTKTILRAAGVEVPMLNIYFNPEGRVSVDFDY